MTERIDTRMKVISLKVYSGQTENTFRKEEISGELEAEGSKGS